MVLFDSHFHLLSILKRESSYTLPSNLIGLEIGLNGGDMRERVERVGNNSSIFLSVGAGPWVLEREDFVSIDDELSKLESDIKIYGADAVGEFGFDNHWKYGTIKAQEELFLKQVALANSYGLPKILHLRDADEIILRHLDKIDNRTIIHCSSSPLSTVEHFLSQGAYISFSGNVTYSANKEIQESARAVPLNRLLYETDSPYLNPERNRRKTNKPENTELTLSFLSELRNEDRELIKNTAINSFYSLMGSTKSIVKRDITRLAP